MSDSGDIMLKKIIATLTVSTLIATTTPITAQSQNKKTRYFLSNVFKREPPNCRIFYPEPIGGLPSHTASEVDQICLPPPIAIIPAYGRDYGRLMQNAIQAGIRGDYNTALINFRRAHLIEVSKEYLGYRNREALRGINGALVAKRYEIEPHPSKRLNPEFFWYHWTGTGDRGNWGKITNQ